MKITVVVVWPIHMDYPLWREQMRRNIDRYERGIVSFSDNNERHDISSGIINLLAPLKMSTLPPIDRKADQDWRSVALERTLEHISTDWIWFTEQDFFIGNKAKFWEQVGGASGYYDAIIYKEGERLHPACLFVRRSAIEKTTKNFGANPGVYDHFGVFTQQLLEQCKITTLEDINLTSGKDYYHMTGLTHNYHRIYEELLPPTSPQEFAIYNNYCLNVYPQHPQFLDKILEIEAMKMMQQIPISDDHFLKTIFENI